MKRCAQRIGPHRAFYGTADTVEDLESLRKALGVKKIGLMGISYGTWVAQEYAKTYPQHTDSLILDSIVGPDRPDGFSIDGFARLPRIFDELCARGRCKSAIAELHGGRRDGRRQARERPAERSHLRRAGPPANDALHRAEPVLLPRHER